MPNSVHSRSSGYAAIRGSVPARGPISPRSSAHSKMGTSRFLVTEVHHRIPQCLLRLRDKADAAPLDSEGIELWLEYEHEAMR